jgi:hypothetical protein
MRSTVLRSSFVVLSCFLFVLIAGCGKSKRQQAKEEHERMTEELRQETLAMAKEEDARRQREIDEKKRIEGEQRRIEQRDAAREKEAEQARLEAETERKARDEQERKAEETKARAALARLAGVKIELPPIFLSKELTEIRARTYMLQSDGIKRVEEYRARKDWSGLVSLLVNEAKQDGLPDWFDVKRAEQELREMPVSLVMDVQKPLQYGVKLVRILPPGERRHEFPDWPFESLFDSKHDGLTHPDGLKYMFRISRPFTGEIYAFCKSKQEGLGGGNDQELIKIGVRSLTALIEEWNRDCSKKCREIADQQQFGDITKEQMQDRIETVWREARKRLLSHKLR